MSSPTTYSGSLQIKKKAELQEIAQALGIPDSGTREDLQSRIRTHLDAHAADLEGVPAFAGLFAHRNKRQRSVQPASRTQSQAPHEATSAHTSSHGRPTKMKMDPVDEEQEERERTPDMRDVSMMLPRAPLSRSITPVPSPRKVPAFVSPATPSSLPPLPPSPAKSILADALAQPEVQAVVEMERSVVRGSVQVLSQTRALLSNGRNIFVITALFDFLSILFTIHHDGPFPIPPLTVQAAPTLHAMALSTTAWAMPGVVLPAVIGWLVSFASAPGAGGFDPLSASIVRVAANIAYDFPVMVLTDTGGDSAHKSLDVLGQKWRVLTASVTLAFAFAEAIGRAPARAQARAPAIVPHTPRSAVPRRIED